MERLYTTFILSISEDVYAFSMSRAVIFEFLFSKSEEVKFRFGIFHIRGSERQGLISPCWDLLEEAKSDLCFSPCPEEWDSNSKTSMLGEMDVHFSSLRALKIIARDTTRSVFFQVRRSETLSQSFNLRERSSKMWFYLGKIFKSKGWNSTTTLHGIMESGLYLENSKLRAWSLMCGSLMYTSRYLISPKLLQLLLRVSNYLQEVLVLLLAPYLRCLTLLSIAPS